MSQKTPGGPLSKQAGTQQKGAPTPGKGSAPVTPKKDFKGGGKK